MSALRNHYEFGPEPDASSASPEDALWEFEVVGSSDASFAENSAIAFRVVENCTTASAENTTGESSQGSSTLLTESRERSTGNRSHQQGSDQEKPQQLNVLSKSQSALSLDVDEQRRRTELDKRQEDCDRAARVLENREQSLNQPIGKFRRFYQQTKAAALSTVYNFATRQPESLAPWIGRRDLPTYLLGRPYVEGSSSRKNEFHGVQEPCGCAPALLRAVEGRPHHVQEFVADFHSLVWFTYRKDFPPFLPVAPHLTSDTGWGCMLRSMQMMLGHTLLRLFLHRDWRVNDRDILTPHSDYRNILRWFADVDDPSVPYSIHNMIHANTAIEEQLLHQLKARQVRELEKIRQAKIRPGASLDRDSRGLGLPEGRMNTPGEHFYPSRVCQIIKRLVRRHSPKDLTAYVATHAHLVRSRVEAIATRSALNVTCSPPRSPMSSFSSHASKGRNFDSIGHDARANGSDAQQNGSSSQSWRPVLILVPVRLGGEHVSDVYIDQLRTIFRMPECCGIVGGRPKESLYFVGYEDDSLFFLDPHTVRPAWNAGLNGNGQGGLRDTKSMAAFVENYHTPFPNTMRIEDCDPSLVIGFLCFERDEFDHLCDQMQRLACLGHPLFHVVETPHDTGLVSSDSSDTDLPEAPFEYFASSLRPETITVSPPPAFSGPSAMEHGRSARDQPNEPSSPEAEFARSVVLI